MGRAVGRQQRQLVLMKARVGLYDDGWGLDQFDGVDRIVSAADPELEDGKEIAFVAVVGLVAAPESWPVLGSLCRRPPWARSQPRNSGTTGVVICWTGRVLATLCDSLIESGEVLYSDVFISGGLPTEVSARRRGPQRRTRRT